MGWRPTHITREQAVRAVVQVARWNGHDSPSESMPLRDRRRSLDVIGFRSDLRMLFKLYDPDDGFPNPVKTSGFLPSEYEQSQARTLGDLVDLFGDYIALAEQAHGRFELDLGFYGGDRRVDKGMSEPQYHEGAWYESGEIRLARESLRAAISRSKPVLARLYFDMRLDMQELEDLGLIFGAAKRVGSPDIEAAWNVYEATSEDHVDEVIYVRAIVNAAVGIGQDTDTIEVKTR